MNPAVSRHRCEGLALEDILLVKLTVKPLTPGRWRDLEKLFGPRGACGGCWCMWWRLRRSEYDRGRGAGNKRRMKRLMVSGEPPGLLAYPAGRDEPVGWISLAPRPQFPVLDRSRVLAPVDEKPVWSVVCFFIAKGWRGKGVGTKLLEAGVKYAKRRGARIVEGYPVAPRKGRLPDIFVWTGLLPMFKNVGFKEVARRSPTRPIVRKAVRAAR